MTQAQRTPVERDPEASLRTPTSRHFDAGGHVAVLQANLARQLRDFDSLGPVAAISPVERLTQFCSRTGGFAMLATGYVVAGILIANWL